MFKNLTRLLCMAFAAAIIATATAAPQAQASRWETVETVESGLSEEIAVTVRDSYIYVTVNGPTPVKLFTILGQPVSQTTIPAGTSRFKVATRGIYILKVGSSTRRITI